MTPATCFFGVRFSANGYFVKLVVNSNTIFTQNAGAPQSYSVVNGVVKGLQFYAKKQALRYDHAVVDVRRNAGVSTILKQLLSTAGERFVRCGVVSFGHSHRRARRSLCFEGFLVLLGLDHR